MNRSILLRLPLAALLSLSTSCSTPAPEPTAEPRQKVEAPAAKPKPKPSPSPEAAPPRTATIRMGSQARRSRRARRKRARRARVRRGLPKRIDRSRAVATSNKAGRPEACGVVHPPQPLIWRKRIKVIRCRGLVHATTDGSRGLLGVVFDEWERLLSRVRKGPLRGLAKNPPPVFVHVYRRTKDCQEYLSLRFSLRGAGCYDPARRVVHVGARGPGGMTRYREVLRHEFTHHLHYSKSKRRPTWVTEGLAELFEASPDEQVPVRVAKLDLEGLIGWKNRKTDDLRDTRARYEQARLLVRALLKHTVTRRPFVKYVLDTPRTRNVADLAQSLNTDVRAIEAAWEKERSLDSAERKRRRASRLARLEGKKTGKRKTNKKQQGKAVATAAAEPAEESGVEGWMLLIGLLTVILPVAAYWKTRPRS